MTIRIVLAFLLMFCDLANAQTHYAPWNADQEYLPYGTLRVNEKFITDQTEILVAEWLGYVVSTCDNNPLRLHHREWRLSAEDKRYLQKFHYPDSLLPAGNILETLEWRRLLDSAGNYRLFTTHGANYPQTIPINPDYLCSKEKRKELIRLLNLPITGISYGQALAFCNWRTKIDSSYAYLDNDTNFLTPRSYYVFRLPTIAEFNYMNQQHDSIIHKPLRSHNVAHRNYGPIGFNYRNVSMQFLNETSKQNDLHESWEFDSDTLGLYAIQGNAAEMTLREGAACGGSYFHYAIESYWYKIQVYEGPERWLGFRCVATIR